MDYELQSLIHQPFQFHPFSILDFPSPEFVSNQPGSVKVLGGFFPLEVAPIPRRKLRLWLPRTKRESKYESQMFLFFWRSNLTIWPRNFKFLWIYKMPMNNYTLPETNSKASESRAIPKGDFIFEPSIFLGDMDMLRSFPGGYMNCLNLSRLCQIFLLCLSWFEDGTGSW